ncbi:Rieske domain-containing protein isoform X2 [Syngnathus typhle]|uniref:Rieske domain-containing protein isoform X2 n=1 Tax=Syngnathus typhle TaxID=161592 RepID=UPI002A6AD345|nr:Rieske domain-containing protein isoform X2 [Syngnathus typhle]
MSCEEKTCQISSSPFLPPPLPPPPASHFIGKRDEVIRRGRVTKLVNGCRDVLVVYHQGEFHAMDMRCYRGALEQGDIEEFNGRTCIVCPWHKYKITLAEGEGLYQAVDNPTVKPLRTHWRSKGVKQRVHKVTEVNEDIYVTLNDSKEAIESDYYQTDTYRTNLRIQKVH